MWTGVNCILSLCRPPGVRLVLLLLVHHGAILPAGQAAVLGCHAAAVFGLVSVAGKKIPLTILTHAGSVAVVQAVHQAVAGETVVGGNGKEGLVPLLEPVEISLLKVVRRYDKMVNSKRNNMSRSQVAEEKVPIRSLCLIRASTILSQKNLSSTSISRDLSRKQ